MKDFRYHVMILFCALAFCMHLSSFSQSSEGKVPREEFDLHYKVFGIKGEHIILLSGGPGSTVDYMQPIADSLSSFYKCVMLEQRGTGRSVLPRYDSSNIRMELYVEDIEALRKHIRSESVILIGSSWGSLLSLLYSAKYPSRVSKIIHLGAGPLSSDYAAIFDDNLRLRFTPYEKELRDFWRTKRRDSLLYVKATLKEIKQECQLIFTTDNLD